MLCLRIPQKRFVRFVAALLLSGFAATAAHAGLVTYTFVPDGPIGDVPTLATFQVDSSVVRSGQFSQLDIQNIQFSFPGIGPLSFSTGSSIGFDNLAYVDPTTGLPTFHDNDQGLAVIAYQDSLFSDTFLSITFDNVGGDLYNAIDGGPGSLGRGTGHFTATFSIDAPPPSPTGVPEPSTLFALTLGTLTALGCARSQRKAASSS